MTVPASDATAPSSPERFENAVFSDSLARSSSPPSSPPGFPWEQQSSTPKLTLMTPSNKSMPSAFSVLGKRKVLDSISANPRPPKKSITTSTSTTTSTTPSDGKSSTLTQLHIDLGQRTRRTCPSCNMEYVPSLPEDAKLHEQYHRQRTSGCPLPKTFLAATPAGKLFACPEVSDAVVRVDPLDPSPRKRRAQAVLEVVQRELGAVPLDEHHVWRNIKSDSEIDKRKQQTSRYQAYLYVRDNRCIGFLLTERVEKAFTVVESQQANAERKESKEQLSECKTTGTSALEALQARRRAAASAQTEIDRRPIQLSTTTTPVQLGVSRIWTLEACRGQKIATTLLDIAKDDAQLSSKAMMAFSQPTQAGARLARRWSGKTYGWKVYA